MMEGMARVLRRRPIALALVIAATGPACGRISSHFSGHTVTRKGVVSASSSTGTPGSTFTLRAGGFKPGESMTFEIDPPKGSAFVGPAHVAGPDGVVTATYISQPTDRPGPYVLKAVGVQGTRATANFTMLSPPSSTR
jgi:hypothetical protein